MFRFLKKSGILSHNSGSRYSRKSIKGSLDTEHSLVSKKNFSQKNLSMGWLPKSGKLGQKGKNMPSMWRHPQKTKRKTLKKI